MQRRTARRKPLVAAALPPAPLVPPYPASGVDRFTDAVDRLPIPWWSFYAIVALVIEAINVTIIGVSDAFHTFRVQFFQLFAPINFVMAMFLMHAFDRQARSWPASRSSAPPFNACPPGAGSAARRAAWSPFSSCRC